MGWFRLYDEFAWDPKVQTLTEVQQRRWVMLMCLRSVCDTGASTDQEVANVLRISLREARQTRAVFVKQGFIEPDSWELRHWEERQSGECESAERVRRHRAKKRNPSLHVTLHGNDRQTDKEIDSKDKEIGVTTALLEVTGLGPEFARVGELAMNMSGDLSWGSWVQQQALAGHSASNIEAAIKEASGVGKLAKGYAIKILQRWAIEGRPQNGRPSAPSKPEPEPMTPEQDAAIKKRKEQMFLKPPGKSK